MVPESLLLTFRWSETRLLSDSSISLLSKAASKGEGTKGGRLGHDACRGKITTKVSRVFRLVIILFVYTAHMSKWLGVCFDDHDRKQVSEVKFTDQNNFRELRQNRSVNKKSSWRRYMSGKFMLLKYTTFVLFSSDGTVSLLLLLLLFIRPIQGTTIKLQ